MQIIVIGCGRVGSQLAQRLSSRGHKVTVVDSRIDAFANLPSEFVGRTIEGEALNRHVLERSGIHEADALAVVTTSDTLNAVVSHVARTVFQVPVVITRNFDPQLLQIHDAFNLQTVSSARWGAQRIEELLYHQEIRTIFSAGNGEVEIYEFIIPQEWSGKRLDAILPEKDCTSVGLTRAGKAFIPACDTILEQGDAVLVSATLEGITALRARLRGIQEG